MKNINLRFRNINNYYIKNIVDLSKYFTPFSGLYGVFLVFVNYLFIKCMCMPVIAQLDNDEAPSMYVMLGFLDIIVGIALIIFDGDLIQDWIGSYLIDKKLPLCNIKLKQCFQLSKISDKFYPILIKVGDSIETSSSYGFVYNKKEQVSGSFMSYYFLACSGRMYLIHQFILNTCKSHKQKQEAKVKLKHDKKEVSKEFLARMINDLQKLEED